ncbi:FAD-binding monooxygenase moxY [Hyphodiscus hymeniophilus]|uniref:FAD-binding monooxygenase moxY n=1 Tax=Hyphodiscus hymeniophilus TaxID=353542 RepID=A0A9P7AZ20_9HELO|nr:FAD-binding monooxygenase moxY [Hyphodiscus hymeniophilus]
MGSLPARSIDTPLPLRILIIGAGISGLGLSIRLRQYAPCATITILEKNAEVGGTWFENRYPGVACDIPSHVYQYTFEPNTQWSRFFSPGEEILEYVKGVARKYRVRELVEFGKVVRGCVWDGGGASGLCVWGRWALGKKRRGRSRGGLMLWLTVRALIGVGSSAIQVLPHLQRKCKDVYHFARGGTWISEPFGGAATQDSIAGDKDSGNYEERGKFKDDLEYYWKYRKHIERFINLDHPCLFPGTESAISGKEGIMQNMKKKLAGKPEIYEALEPKWSPGCRRLTPGPGFLEALVKDNVHFSRMKIVGVSKNEILLENGTRRKVDAIICATGFDTSFLPRFPIEGHNGTLLSEQWKDTASSYLSLATPNFPNLFTVGGPNSATGGGSLLIIFESIIGYVAKCVQKMSREHVCRMEVKAEALRAWEEYMEAYFPTTVHVEACTSWYKAGKKDNRVVGLWPGSSLHARKTLEHPRWEDWDFRYGREMEGSVG